MAEKLIVVRVAYDPEAQVWWIESSDLSRLHAEGATLEELRDQLPGMISDLIEDNEPSWRNHDIVVEIIAHGQLRTRVPAVREEQADREGRAAGAPTGKAPLSGGPPRLRRRQSAQTI